MLSTNWEEYFAEEQHQPSSSSSWSSTSWWSSSSWSSNWQRWHQQSLQDDRWSERWVKQPGTRVSRSRESNQATGAVRLRSDKLKVVTNSHKVWLHVQSCLNLFFLQSFALSQQQSATESVDIILTQTHANAHFFSYMHHSALSTHFQCVNTTLAQCEKEFVSRVRLHSFPSRLRCRCWTSRSLVFLKSSPHQLVPLLKTSATSTSFCGSRNNLCASARCSGMSGHSASPSQNTGYDPNFYSFLNEKHTPINLPDRARAVTTLPSSQLPKIQKFLAREHPAAARKPQPAEFPPCYDLKVRVPGNSGLSWLTAGCCFSMTVFQWCFAPPVDVPVTSDSWWTSEGSHRCVWHATSRSASDGYQANSTAVTGAAENMTTHTMPPGVSSSDGRTIAVSVDTHLTVRTHTHIYLVSRAKRFCAILKIGVISASCPPIASSPICHDPQPRQTPLTGNRGPPASPLNGVECLAAWPIRLQTQVRSPSSVSKPAMSTRWSTSLTATRISRTTATPPRSPQPRNLMYYLGTQERQAAASMQPQQAGFPPCQDH